MSSDNATGDDAAPVCEHEFTLVLRGADQITRELEEALFEHGCDDATLSCSHQRLWLDVVREAATLEEAVATAIRDVRRAGAAMGVPLDVERLDACPFITQAGIARRLGCSRQYLGQLVVKGRKGRRFPAAACHLHEGNPVWQLVTVARWLADLGMVAPQMAEEAVVIDRLNAALSAEAAGRQNASAAPRMKRGA